MRVYISHLVSFLLTDTAVRRLCWSAGCVDSKACILAVFPLLQVVEALAALNTRDQAACVAFLRTALPSSSSEDTAGPPQPTAVMRLAPSAEGGSTAGGSGGSTADGTAGARGGGSRGDSGLSAIAFAAKRQADDGP